ncbi:MAG: hypothetical protein SOY47_00030 [Lachnospiraceae bacterium]|nr:hypothetical protein [Lachnospiraceae bacterium]
MGKYEQVGTIYNWHIPAQRYDGRIENPDSVYAIIGSRCRKYRSKAY